MGSVDSKNCRVGSRFSLLFRLRMDFNGGWRMVLNAGFGLKVALLRGGPKFGDRSLLPRGDAGLPGGGGGICLGEFACADFLLRGLPFASMKGLFEVEEPL